MKHIQVQHFLAASVSIIGFFLIFLTQGAHAEGPLLLPPPAPYRQTPVLIPSKPNLYIPGRISDIGKHEDHAGQIKDWLAEGLSNIQVQQEMARLSPHLEKYLRAEGQGVLVQVNIHKSPEGHPVTRVLLVGSGKTPIDAAESHLQTDAISVRVPRAVLKQDKDSYLIWLKNENGTVTRKELVYPFSRMAFAAAQMRIDARRNAEARAEEARHQEALRMEEARRQEEALLEQVRLQEQEARRAFEAAERVREFMEQVQRQQEAYLIMQEQVLREQRAQEAAEEMRRTQEALDAQEAWRRAQDALRIIEIPLPP